MPFCRLVGPVDAIAVDLARQDVGQVAVPDQVGALGQDDAARFLVRLRRIEQAQLDLGRVLRIERKVHAAAVPRRPQRVRVARPDSHCRYPFVFPSA